MERHYPSDVSDAEWAWLEPFFIDRNAPRKRGRPETPEFARRSFNAIRHLLKTGCQWRMLPKEYPSRTTVHDAFTRWTKSGLWERINSALREQRRIGVKKTPRPAARWAWRMAAANCWDSITVRSVLRSARARRVGSGFPS